MFRLLYLGDGWADCVEVSYALGDPLLAAYAVATDGVTRHVRTCRVAPPVQSFPQPPHRASVSLERLGRLCSNLVCGSGVITFPQVLGGVSLHVSTCNPHLRILGSK